MRVSHWFRKYINHHSGKERVRRHSCELAKGCQTKHFPPETKREVRMLEHCPKQCKKSTPQALIYAPCVMVKKKKSMLIAYVFKNTLNYSIKIKICLRKQLLSCILIEEENSIEFTISYFCVFPSEISAMAVCTSWSWALVLPDSQKIKRKEKEEDKNIH